MRHYRLIVLCLAALCFGGLATAVSAAPLKDGVNAVAGFCQESEFCAFVSMEEEWPDTVMAKAQLDGKTQAFSMEEIPVHLEEDGCPVSYLLLVDCSGSMLGKRSDNNPQNLVREYAGALYDAAGGGARFAVATFDEHFNEDATDFTDHKRSFLEDVSSIQYNAQWTDLTQSTLEALDYLEAYRRESGELVNLVLVTDGIPDGADERMTPAVAAERINVSPSILVHTFGIGTSDSRSRASLDSLAELGQGAHTAALNSRRQDARAAAEETAALVNSLYPLRFSLGRDQSSVADAMIYFYDQAVENGSAVSALTKLSGIPVLASTGEVISKAEPKPVEDIYLPSTGSSGDVPEDGGEAEGEADSDSEEPSEAPSEEGASSSGTASSGGGAGQYEEEPKKSFPVIPVVLGAAAVLAVLAAAYVVLKRRRPKPGAGSMKIYMRLEVVSGQLATKEEGFYLTDELLIGKARNCDIVLKEAGLAKQCARIFLSDNMIWIEDTGAEEGVYLGGMRLYNANRLRSGDEISIGNTRFLFKF